MKRLAKFDVSRRFAKPSTRIAVEIAFGAACAITMIALRSVIDVWAPTSGPFALVYPTVLLATLYGHWRAGLVAYAASFLWAWYFVLPVAQGFAFEIPTDPPRVIINAVATLILIVFAEGFRRAVVAAMEERDKEIERRIVLMQELEHRTKNNFALAASLLELQKRQGADVELSQALDQAVSRIRSFAHAYENVAESQGEGASVSMQNYLGEVVRQAHGTAFRDGVVFNLEADECELPREVSVAIGLFTNEVLTNCAKHAFPDGGDGTVDVRFACKGESWSLVISDDGMGSQGEQAADASSGLGTKLLQAFAQQAKANYVQDFSRDGCTVRLESA